MTTVLLIDEMEIMRTGMTVLIKDCYPEAVISRISIPSTITADNNDTISEHLLPGFILLNRLYFITRKWQSWQ